LRTGGADQGGEGWITVEDLHVYARAKVREAAPAMTPEFYPVKEGYTIKLAQSQKDDPALKYRKEVQNRVHQGSFSIPARRLLDFLRISLHLDEDLAEAIEVEVLRPFQEYRRKVQEYEETLREALKAEPELSQRTLEDLKDYQQHLGLRDEDVAELKSTYLSTGSAAQFSLLKAKPKAEVRLEPLEEKVRMNRYSSLRERAITLRDAGKLAPVAIVEYFSAGIDSDFDEIEAKLNAFAEDAE
jgi:hypothetical protein